MNIAVFSDIHGNHLAFEACMKHIGNRNIDAYIFMGDYVGEFPGIEQTLDRIMELDRQDNCFVLRGNKEEYQLQGLAGDPGGLLAAGLPGAARISPLSVKFLFPQLQEYGILIAVGLSAPFRMRKSGYELPNKERIYHANYVKTQR